MDDQTIIRLFFERSEQAVAELHRAHGASVRRVTANILENSLDVEESISDTYLHIWNAIPPQMPRSLRAFCCGVARNTALTRYHANTAQKRNSRYDAALEELEGCIPARDTVEEVWEAKELARYLNRFLERLDYDDRFAFVRRYYFGDSVTDLAEAMGLSPHWVTVRLSRIRANLKKSLRKEGLLP